MQPQDVFNRAFDVATAELDRWLTAQASVASIDRESRPWYWRARIRPHVANACSAELMLSRNQTFDLEIGDEGLASQPISDFSLYLPLLQEVAAGNVVIRSWSALATGGILTREAIVTLPGGQFWSIRRFISAGTVGTESSAVARDQHYVPYRRG